MATTPLPCHRGRVPADVDVSPWDNCGTKKEGVACTYKTCDRYAPMFARLGLERYLVRSELRPGDQRGQCGTPEFLDRAVELARGVTEARPLVRVAENRQPQSKQKMPLSKPVTRGRLRSVIQDLMYLAARLTCHARRFGLGLWRDDPWRFVWKRLYYRFARRAAIGSGRSP